MSKIKNNKLVYHDVTEPIVVQANYLASRQDDSHVDDGISIATGIMPWNYGTPPCSHTEIGFIVDGELWFASSTSRGSYNGTRWVKGSVLLRHPERWLLQVRRYPKLNHISQHLINIRIERANKLMGLTYDFVGVFTDFAIPWAITHEHVLTPQYIEKLKKIYCSKFVHTVDTGMVSVYSPRRQYTYARKHDYKIVDIKELKGYLK